MGGAGGAGGGHATSPLLPVWGAVSQGDVCWEYSGTGPAPHRGLTERRILPSTIQDQSHHSPRLLKTEHETRNSLPRYLSPSRSGKKKKSKRKSQQEHLSVILANHILCEGRVCRPS